MKKLIVKILLCICLKKKVVIYILISHFSFFLSLPYTLYLYTGGATKARRKKTKTSDQIPDTKVELPPPEPAQVEPITPSSPPIVGSISNSSPLVSQIDKNKPIPNSDNNDKSKDVSPREADSDDDDVLPTNKDNFREKNPMYKKV